MYGTGMANSGSRSESRRHGSSSYAHSSTFSVSSPTSDPLTRNSPSTGGPSTSNESSTSGTPPTDGRRESSRHQVLSHINSIFKCTICFGRLTDTHLCPQCSKLYCYDCIGEWLDSGSSQTCPNCKIPLRLEQLVKVRWFDDIQQLQQKLRMTLGNTSTTGLDDSCLIVDTVDTVLEEPDGSNELCPRHQKTLNFYCATCEQCICEVCATDVIEGRHRDHTFKALHVTYEQHRSALANELEKVEHYRDQVVALMDKIDRNVELIGRVKTMKLKELEAIMLVAMGRLDQQEDDMLAKLYDHRCTLSLGLSTTIQKLNRMQCQIAVSTKPQLIQMRSKIVSECNAIRLNPLKDFKEIRVPASLKIEIPVLFETGIFVVQNFSTFDDNKVVYSKEFADCTGRTWRIMAWCVISEDHFGIYLELVSGLPCLMECTFKLLHDDPEKTISKSIRQYFDRTPQKGWGLRDFVTLRTILDENYLRQDDSLELLYNIRPRESGHASVAEDTGDFLNVTHDAAEAFDGIE